MWRGIHRWSVLLILLAGATGAAEARPARRAKAALAPMAENTPAEQAPALDPVPEMDLVRPRDPQILDQKEMLSLVKVYANEIAAALVDGERHREEAVRLRDAIKLACIQDRLSGMKLMKKLSDDRLDATARPDIRADELNFRHEYRGVEMAHERILQLQRELVECVGESLEVADQPAPPSPVPGSGGGGSIDPGGTDVEIPPLDRPAPASMYK